MSSGASPGSKYVTRPEGSTQTRTGDAGSRVPVLPDLDGATRRRGVVGRDAEKVQRIPMCLLPGDASSYPASRRRSTARSTRSELVISESMRRTLGLGLTTMPTSAKDRFRSGE